MLGWTAALIVPNLAIAAWWFRGVSPLEFLLTLYSSEQPLALRVPLMFVCIGALAGMFATKRGTNFLQDASRLRVAGLAATGVLLIATLTLAPGTLAILPGIAIVLAACSLGLRLLASPPLLLLRERFDSPLERIFLATSMGLGALALLVFVLGSTGVLSAAVWWVLLFALLIQGASLLHSTAADLRESVASFVASAHPLAIAAAIFTFAWCAAHLFLLWSPPLDYDVLEYHLAAPAQYLREGRVSFLHENVYATFWQNGEMLYLLALALPREKLSGLPAAHFVLFASWVLSICGVYALSARAIRERGEQGTPAPALAALLYALIPLGSHLVSDFYIEHFQALFHIAAVLAGYAFVQEQRRGQRQRSAWLILAGALAGYGCAAKYPALLFTLAPLLILIPFISVLRGAVYEALSSAATIGLSALAVLAPWILRNTIASGDPMHPLGLVMKRRAAATAATPDHLDHFDIATRAGERSLSALLNVVYQVFPGLAPSQDENSGLSKAFRWVHDAECGPQTLSFALPGFVAAWRGAGFLIAFFLIDCAAWFIFTYRLNRFLYPLLGPLIVISALGIAQLWKLQPLRKVAAALTLLIALSMGPLSILYVWSLTRIDHLAGREDAKTAAREQYTLFGNANWFAAWAAINELPSGSRVLFIGDAQTFYLEKTPVYSVVFNPHLLEEVLAEADDAQEAARLLAGRGITHIYINYPEWFRLDASYSLQRADEKFELARAPMLDRPTRESLRQLLYQRQFYNYGRAWPPQVFPAYLKLSHEQYRLLDRLLNRHAPKIADFPDEHGRRTCELRQIMLSIEAPGTVPPGAPK
ncbi:MAG TPA: hypothetical protein VEK08_25465 [Planctomycetota bacterium]|nr:hypothetical protein [Planctomycetota bacterium]